MYNRAAWPWSNTKAEAKASFCTTCLLEKPECKCPKPETSKEELETSESTSTGKPRPLSAKTNHTSPFLGRLRKNMTSMSEIYLGQTVYYIPKYSLNHRPEPFVVKHIVSYNNIHITSNGVTQRVALFELTR